MAILIGTGKNQVPTNGDLGSLAYQNHDEVEIDNGRAALDEYQKTFKAPKIKPTLNLPFAKMQTFDPRVTFTRASDAYEYKGDSVKAEENLVLYSEQFDNAYWIKSNVTVEANQTLAPNGTNTADLLAETATTAVHNITAPTLTTGAVSSQYVSSFYVKKGNGATAPDWIQIYWGGSANTAAYVNFNISNGTLGASGGGAIGAISLSANGFYRIAMIATANPTSSLLSSLVFTNNSDALGRAPSYTGQTTSDVFVWGAQLEQRSTLTDYQRTTDRIIQKYVDTYSLVTSNKPRFKEIDPVTKERKGLLVEEARTNFFTRSNQFTDAVWQKGSVTVIAGVPDVLANNGFYIREQNDSALKYLFTNSGIGITPNVSVTISAFFKEAPGAKRYVQFSNNDAISSERNLAVFDVAAKTFIAASGVTATVESFSNGWVRATATFTSASSTLSNQIRLRNSFSLGSSYQGDGFSGIYISQAQLEVGSFATSPILTLGSTVTRAEENSTVPISNFQNYAEGTIYGDFQSIGENNTDVNTVGFFGPSSGISIIDKNGQSGQIFTSGFVIRVNQVVGVRNSLYNKKAISYTFDSVISSGNGFVTPPIVPAAIPNDITGFAVGSTTPGQKCVSFIRHVVYYPKALTADELAFLTRNTNE